MVLVLLPGAGISRLLKEKGRELRTLKTDRISLLLGSIKMSSLKF
jgi:hypothetical protein